MVRESEEGEGGEEEGVGKVSRTVMKFLCSSKDEV